MSQPVFSFAILGAGGRGNGFSQWIAQRPEQAKVVAVAEPDAKRRQQVAQRHNLPADMQFESWEALLARPKLADAVVNTLMDRLHAPSAVKALGMGYHMLLEKPMAVTLEDCIAIDAARCKNHRIVAICHSLRHHVVYAELKRLIASGVIGRVMSVDQLEGVDPVHQSHSFVRGNWGNESRSTFMLMSKSCHDVDLLAWLVDQPCLKVSSFGHLSHFCKESVPAGAPQRCTDGCPVESTCTYSAIRIYVHAKAGWYHGHAGMADMSMEERMQNLRTSPFGRCVYQTDNDVVDHQVVNFEFAGNITGTFTMTAFDVRGRRTRVHGTEGVIEAHIDSANTLEVIRFRDGAKQKIEIPNQAGGHGGGDANLLDNFLLALRNNNPEAVLTGTQASLQSHAIVFAAEMSRRESRVVELAELLSPAVAARA